MTEQGQVRCSNIMGPPISIILVPLYRACPSLTLTGACSYLDGRRTLDLLNNPIERHIIYILLFIILLFYITRAQNVPEHIQLY